MGSTTIPGFLNRSALAARAGKPNQRILVVVQLLGGNDGLNTVVPHGIDGYNRGRRVLRLSPGQVHKITPEIGLHPGMGGFAKLLEGGKLSIAQGVGYPNPDRSHFRSMEIWETGRLDNDPKSVETGWLGRALDARPARPGDDPPALNIGNRALPQALHSRKTEVPSLENLESYKLQGTGSEPERQATRSALTQVAALDRREDDPVLGFIRRTTLAAYESSGRLEQIAQKKQTGPTYPNFGLARRLELIAQLIKADFGTRIFYAAQDGYDTHANQLGSHQALLTELADSIAAFHDDLEKAKLADRVVVLSFSEFGRRTQENASQGTDHGAAAPVFLVGPVAKPGLIGAHPSLDDLDDGDLKFHTDFRRVYAAILAQWLDCPVEPVIGPGFQPLALLRRS
jgi:uncharacterized protein (DUF1501 family)